MDGFPGAVRFRPLRAKGWVDWIGGSRAGTQRWHDDGEIILKAYCRKQDNNNNNNNDNRYAQSYRFIP